MKSVVGSERKHGGGPVNRGNIHSPSVAEECLGTLGGEERCPFSLWYSLGGDREVEEL